MSDSVWNMVSAADALHLGGNMRFGDTKTFSPKTWDWVIDRFCIDLVLDLGSGLGHASHYFRRRGLHVIAVDGLIGNVANALVPTVLHDLANGPVQTRVDLVHCQEVAEHIEERYLDNLLGSLLCGKYIMMTNALPGQDGWHHVNLQPTSYWIEHMEKRGCATLAEETNLMRMIASGEGSDYLAASGVLYANTGRV